MHRLEPSAAPSRPHAMPAQAGASLQRPNRVFGAAAVQACRRLAACWAAALAASASGLFGAAAQAQSTAQARADVPAALRAAAAESGKAGRGSARWVLEQTYSETLAAPGPPAQGQAGAAALAPLATRMLWITPRQGNAAGQGAPLAPGIGPDAVANRPAAVLGFGVGLEQASAAPPSGVVALRWQASAQTAWVMQWPVTLTPTRATGWHDTLADRQASGAQIRLGLSFRSRDPYASLRHSALLRLELNSQSVLSFKPRGGRIVATLHSRW